MIIVIRPEVPTLFKDASNRELRRVLEYFEPEGKPPEGKPEFKFNAYKQPIVAETLKAAFHKKCAYCESRMAAVTPADIDHFRPKGAVDIGGKLTPTGYYWLAAEWSNLLPSCPCCNRRYNHYFRDEGRKVKGKGCAFPLMDEGTRAWRSRDPLHAEYPLILDPCGSIDPGDHLEFYEDGWIDPRIIEGEPSQLGKITIENLALRRQDLVEERRDWATFIVAELDLIVKHANPRTSDDNHNLAAHLKILRDRLNPRHQYIAMARQIIDRRQPGLRQTLDKFIRGFEARASSLN